MSNDSPDLDDLYGVGAEDRARMEAAPRQLRDQANIEANKAANPYSIGVPAENWQRGYNGERCIAAVGSAAHTYWKEGVAARKAKEATNEH